MASLGVHLTAPSAFPVVPDQLPAALPPPAHEHSVGAPFGIPPRLFEAALRPEIPLVLATAYVGAVFALNAYNRQRGYQPWPVAARPAFQNFVVVHKVLLALLSAATFSALLRAIVHVWPGWRNPYGAAGVADALCKLHGPRGLGDAATFNTTIHIWEVKNPAIHLAYDGRPDPTDVGRLWNEGLAFWGWLFYVSKFYEVVDALISLAKGKTLAPLQTYPHACAILCTWAGIRYMSPPIWMLVFVNSGIHAAMYALSAVSALGYRVPPSIGLSLTALQIGEFVFGAVYATAHLFVQYDMPISVPYHVAAAARAAVSSVSTAVASATSDASSAITAPTASAALGALVKKLLLRAAGEEGVAERVHLHHGFGESWGSRIEDKIEQFNHRTYYETHWYTEWTRANCIDTTGEAFAIYLNLLYLAPLAWLLGRFCIQAYGQWRTAKTVVQDADQYTGEVVEQTLEQKVENWQLDKVQEKPLVNGAGSKADEGTIVNEPEGKEAQTEEPAEPTKEPTGVKVKEEEEAEADAKPELGSGTNNEPEGKQEENLESSKAVREGAGDEKSGGLLGRNNEPEAKQDENVDASKPVRPGPEAPQSTDAPQDSAADDNKEDESTDAMGKSGSIIDLAKETPTYADIAAPKEEKGSTEAAPPTPPGTEES